VRGAGPLCPEAEALRAAAAEFFGPMAEFPGRQTLNAATRGKQFEARYERIKSALEAMRGAVQAVDPVTEESVALERRCREIDAQLTFIARADDETYVYWLDVRGRTVVLSASPVDVSNLLQEALFEKVHAAVLTSATLSVDEDFSFVRERLGIGTAEERVVPSPFDYKTQAVLYLPSSMPEPRDDGYKERMLREIEALVGISRGRAFLLFTSYGELRRVEEALRHRTRFPLLVQGEKPRAKLLEEFRETESAILLGAASFWHGVDVAGEALSLVVIDKIPFDVPNDPLVSARIERIRSLGGDPFRDYQIPSAAIELKQGLGRLIRSRADRGILAVLDARLRTRSYGTRLLKAIPPFPVVSDLEQVRRFFQEPPGNPMTPPVR
jgi:ATP-dependent DNA helicase DinG